MSHIGVKPGEPETLQVFGDLTFATVSGVLRASEMLSGGRDHLTYDLSAVQRTDSAALALLLEWRSRARVRGGDASFLGLPESLLDIARLSNADSLLPQED
ncbi:MAG: STAS domain-containing protein [Gammaproteobacteria bacterium]|nr:STAS domain-containing protein [Gammaproteobacteria bacterium]